jgi:sulfonate transport system ATP-binding protein
MIAQRAALAPARPRTLLRLTGVGKTYANGAHALDAFDLSVAPGEIVAIVGGSGCGKSTLLRLVAGLDTPSEGGIAIAGRTITEPVPEVGIVFQEPRLLPWLTVEGNIAFGLDGLSADEKRRRVADLLDRVGLAGYETRWPRELSGGQAQRIAIARALAPAPQVLLLDEPFSALDAFTRASLHDHLLALWRRSRPVMLIVTHDIAEAVSLADRVVVMRPNPGRIEAILDVPLAHPRDPLADGFDRIRREALRRLDGTMQKARTAGPEIEAAAHWW